MKSYSLQSDRVALEITELGGHMAPVWFDLGEGKRVNPYSLPPWSPEDFPDQPACVRVLRGDFFCFPFGESDSRYSPHGETANGKWELADQGEEELVLRRTLKEFAGRVEKSVRLRPGDLALYQEHRISGVTGEYNYGHHPILAFPEGVSCPLRTSPFRFGSVYPDGFAGAGERSALRPGARFSSLHAISTADGREVSLAEYPALDGCEDLVMLTAAGGELAWTAVTFPGYVWVSLRPVASFPSTLLWVSNGGRPQAPWNGRHLRRLGVEDVCSWFHEGVLKSRAQHLQSEEIPTVRKFEAGQTTRLRQVQFVHPVAGSPGLKALSVVAPDGIRLEFENGDSATASVDAAWLTEASEASSVRSDG